MMENTELINQIKDIETKVTEYFDKNILFACPNINRDFLIENKEHIVNIGTSMYCTKHNIGYPGGNFVQAVINGNLNDAYGYADDVNSTVLRFYVMMLYNM